MRAAELRDLTVEELKKRLTDEEENLANLRFQHATAQLESSAKLRTVRRDIARMKTVMREREMERAHNMAVGETPSEQTPSERH